MARRNDAGLRVLLADAAERSVREAFGNLADRNKREPKRACRIVYMKDGVPIECGGVIREVRVPQSCSMTTPIGGPPRRPVMTYAQCQRCRVMFSVD